MVKNVFEELSTTISDRERKDLLKKIKVSMNLNTSIDESIYHVDISKEDKEKALKEEIRKLGFFSRLILKIIKFLTGKSEESIYDDKRFAALKKTILKKAPGITVFETRTISKKMADTVYSLYMKVSPLINVFEDFWSKGDTFNKVLVELIETRTGGIIRDISDIISDEEIEKILLDRESKTAVKEEVLKRLNTHLKDFPESVFEEIEKEILPLYYYRGIIGFSYLSFLKGFGFDPYSEKSSFSFRNAPILGCLDNLEKLYYAVYMVLKVPKPVKINRLFAKFFYRDDPGTESAVETEDPENPENPDKTENPESLSEDTENVLENVPVKTEDALLQEIENEDDEKKLKWFYNKLMEIHEECTRIHKKIPLVELIKYYRNDIYFKLAFYVPRLKLKDFYAANLKIKVLDQINEKYIKARNSLIEKNIERFFKGREMKKFMHFRVYTSFDYQKMEIGYFSHLKSLEILYNYLEYYYNQNLRHIIDIVTRSVMSQDKITVNTIMMHMSNIDDAYIRIQDFDSSLSPETEDGKLFLRLRYGLGSDPAYLKMYKTFIMQKNKISQDIIQRAIESFDYLIKTYSEILKTSLYEIKNYLNSHYTYRGKTKTFRDHITETLENMKYFKSLLVQLVKLDEGR